MKNGVMAERSHCQFRPTCSYIFISDNVLQEHDMENYEECSSMIDMTRLE